MYAIRSYYERYTISSLLVAAVLLSAVLPGAMHAQSPFRLKRTKKESTPINVTLMAGYNGMSEPANILLV